jgi:hypothetical protein
MNVYGYPKDRIAVEKPVYFGSAVHEKAAAIVVWEENAPSRPYIIVEVKKPGGRAAIVLPQGRFNNSGDEAIRAMDR